MATIRLKGYSQPIIVSLNQGMQIKALYEDKDIPPDHEVRSDTYCFKKREIRFVILDDPKEKPQKYNFNESYITLDLEKARAALEKTRKELEMNGVLHKK